MQASTRAFIKRGGAICAAAVVLIGGTFTTGAAMASPSQDVEPSSISSAAALSSATPATSATSATKAALPDGFAVAVERDLDMSVEEFIEQSMSPTDSGKSQGKTAEEAQASAANIENLPTRSPATVSTPDRAAPARADSAETLLTDYIAEFGSFRLESIMRNAAGEFVIRTGEPATGGPATARSATLHAETPISQFASKYDNVTVVAAGGPASPFIDVTNGQGYATPVQGGAGLCSIGFNGFNVEGKDAVITTGHCTNDGNALETFLTDPTLDDAAGSAQPGLIAPLGQFGGSQFGGPGNTPNVPGTDVAVIDIPEVPQAPELALTLLPQVTDWKTPADPKASGPMVTGISAALVGAPICKSGRTTGWTCGTVEEIGFFAVAGRSFPATDENPNICEPPAGLTVPGCDDVRIVNGFGTTNMRAIQGDSGGAIVSGTTALGMISAGIPNKITYGVSLTDALSNTAGYSIKMALNAPTIDTVAPVYRAGTITGTAPGASVGYGATVDVTVGTEPVVNVPVGAGGAWSVPAPNTVGPVTVTALSRNRINVSDPTTATLEIIQHTLPLPVITAPLNEGTVAAPVTSITGRGTAGATIEVIVADEDEDTENVTGTAVVGTDNNWSFDVKPGLTVGNYTVTALQSRTDWNDSPTATSTFNVVYAAPAVVSPANGAEFAFNEGPGEISGTNIAGASVVVTVNDTSYNAVVKGTTWSVALNAPLSSGSYTVTAVQSVDGVQSLVATSSFSVLAEPAPVPTTPAPAPSEAPAPAPGDTEAPAPGDTETPAPGGSDMDLANTGASGTTVLLSIAGGLLLLGGAAFLLIRRRSTN